MKIREAGREGSFTNTYVLFGENRGLLTLQRMRDSEEISFDQRDYILQFEKYYSELDSLIQANKGTRERVELFRYQDTEEGERSFNTTLLQRVYEWRKFNDTSPK